ncbi:MAG: hypothetical protein D6734_10295 [Candidatus Schekmanbacteria bacterium]|nr:MAG: hypothetical protein D6734_10295 [Candidatus Schekmanbacteria bacterium]
MKEQFFQNLFIEKHSIFGQLPFFKVILKCYEKKMKNMPSAPMFGTTNTEKEESSKLKEGTPTPFSL